MRASDWFAPALSCSAACRHMGEELANSVFDERSSLTLRPLTIIGATDLSLNRRARHRDCAPRLGCFHPLARPWTWYFPDWRRLFAEPAGGCSWSPAGSAESSSLPGEQSCRVGRWHFAQRHPRCPIRAQGWLHDGCLHLRPSFTVVDNEQTFKCPEATLFPADWLPAP